MNVPVVSRLPDFATLSALRSLLGPAGFSDDPHVLAPLLAEPRGRFVGKTAALLRPANTEQVAAVVGLCARAGVGIVPQGGNTGLVGGQTPRASGGELLLSLSRLDQVRQVDALANTLTAEAGCTLASVQEAALRAERLFPLSLASEGTCQIGGNLSTNAGGIHVLRYGNARDLVLGLEVVTADGQIWNGLRSLRKDNTGYDLKHLFLGAEGTLGVITAAVLKLFPRHRDVQTVFAAIPSLAAAVTLLSRLRAALDDAVLAFELMPRSGLEMVLRHLPGAIDPLPSPHPPRWYVLIDLTVERGRAEAALAGLVDQGELLGEVVVASNPAQGASLWRMRESMSEVQGREGGSIKHDVSVPIAHIPSFVEEGIAAVSRLIPGVRPVPFGHVGDGNLHFNFSQPAGADRSRFLARWEEVNRVVHDLVIAHGGSISAEHGIGQGKRDEIRRYKDPVEMELMRRIKVALDPAGIMNPGKGVV